jgi:hypothetical protein
MNARAVSDACGAKQANGGGADAIGVSLGVGMVIYELLRLVVHPGDVAFQLLPLHAPLTTSPDLDRLELAATHERVGLRPGDVEYVGHVGEC